MRAQAFVRSPWWGLPARNSLDRATALLPALLAERLDEIGIDHAVLYPTYGLVPTNLDDGDLRRAVARAFNTFYAEEFRDHRAKLTPVGIIPMHTPEEALAELEYATGTLGLDAFMFGGPILRPVPGLDHRAARWLDTLGVDSLHDYDPVWQRCAELGIAPTFHTPVDGLGDALVADQLRLQPHRHVRDRRRGGGALAAPGRRAAPLPDAALRVPRGRRRVGREPLLGPRRPLREAQPRGGRALQPEAPRPRAARRAVRQVRLGALPRAASTSSRTACASSPIPTRPNLDEFAQSGVEERRGHQGDVRAASTSAARPTIRSRRSRSTPTATRSARGSSRSSRPTSGTGTCPTSARCCPRHGSWSSTATSTRRSSARSRTRTRCRSGRRCAQKFRLSSRVEDVAGYGLRPNPPYESRKLVGRVSERYHRSKREPPLERNPP